MQRHRLGLLVTLATHHARGLGISRERLVGLLWPEADPERGRPLLSDSVYRINQAVGAEAIVSVGDELRLNDAVVSSDIAAFERAFAADEWEQAVALYTGPLLDGVHLVDASDFERCLDAQRDRVARLYETALNALAERAEADGATADAVRWWRRLAAHDPFSSRVAIRLMEALAALGDAAGAVRHAQIHAALVQNELGAAPNAAIVRLAERLKAEPAGPIPTSSAARAIAEVPTAELVDAEACAPVPDLSPNVAAVTSARAAHRPSTTPCIVSGWRLGVGMTLFAAIGVIGWVRPHVSSAAPTASIAVLPFVDLSPKHDNGAFSDGMTDEIIVSLTQVNGVHVAARTSVFALRDDHSDVRDVGRRLGVATVLAGSVRRAGDRLRISVQLADATDGFQVWSESYDRDLGDAFAIQEEVSRSVVTAVQNHLGRTILVNLAGIVRP